MHRRIRTAGYYRPAFLALGALAVLGGCSTGTVTLRPQGGISSFTPATATPTAAPSGSSTATPTPKPTSTATPTVMPTSTPTPHASSSPSSAFTFATNYQNPATALVLPMLPSGCPSSYFTQPFSVQETGYSGTFTATSSNTSAVTVASAGTPQTFNVTDLLTTGNYGSTPDNVYITVTDTVGNYGVLPVAFSLACL